MKQDSRIKNYCNDCHHETWHNVLYVSMEKGSVEDISWYKEYAVLQCAGCDRICFRTEASDSESYDVDEYGNWIPDISVENFPPTNEGIGNIENLYEIPDEIRSIYNETLKAISDGCYTLAGIGLRATIEAICNHENIAGANLDNKINKLYTNGFISKDDANKLHAIRFIGNDAAHDIKAPLKAKVIIALKIIEHLLSTKYAMQNEINRYMDLPVNTYDEFKIMLNKKIFQSYTNNTFTLRTLIGKDKRRIKNSDFDTYIQQYESEIQNGTITIIEDVTGQIQNINNANPSNQKIYRKKQ